MTGVRTVETIRQKHVIRVDFFMIRIDPSPILFYFYFFIRVDPTRTGGPSWSGPTFVPAYLKCLFVQCRKYHKSRWNGAAELHISVDLLCGITAAELHNSVDLLCGTTDAEIHNSPVNLLCGIQRTPSSTTRFDACTRSSMHFPKKNMKAFQSKILLRV